MKKISLLIISCILLLAPSIAQRNNISPKIQAERDMMAIERKMSKENTDEEGVKLIKAHSAAKTKMEGVMKKKPGYGDAATSKEKIQKFREKVAKKDADFAKLSQAEKDTRKAKEDYIASKDEKYSSLRKIAQE